MTKKIVKSLVDLKINPKKYKTVGIGNLNSVRDWGYAGEYVYGMWKILQMKNADDYLIGTGKVISVREFINYAMNYLNFKNFIWKGKGLNEKLLYKKKIIFKVDKKYFRKTEVDFIQCNINASQKKLNWKPKIVYKSLIEKMIDDEFILRKI